MYQISIPVKSQNFDRCGKERILCDLKKVGAKRVFLTLATYEPDPSKRNELMNTFRENAAFLKKEGFENSLLFVHVPLYQYTEAAEEFFTGDLESCRETYFDYPESYIKNREAFRFGVNYEGPSAPIRDNGFFDTLVSEDHTRHVLCGHNHVNTSSVDFKGVRLTYGVKTGVGSYRRGHLNGGTVLEIMGNGFDARHEYVKLENVTDVE